MAQLGGAPVLIGAVGADFDDYRVLARAQRRRLRLRPRLADPPHRALRLHHRRGDVPDRLVLRRRDERGAQHRARPGLGRHRRRPRRHQRLRPGGDGAAQRRVPRARATASPPTRPSRSPGWPATQLIAAHRGRRPAVHQRLREAACSSPRPAWPTPRSWPGSTSGSPRSAQGRRDRRPRRRAGARPGGQGAGQGRPHRRRRRVPRRLPHRPRAGACRGSARPQVGMPARRRWCSRRVGTQEYGETRSRRRRTDDFDRRAPRLAPEVRTATAPRWPPVTPRRATSRRAGLVDASRVIRWSEPAVRRRSRSRRSGGRRDQSDDAGARRGVRLERGSRVRPGSGGRVVGSGLG